MYSNKVSVDLATCSPISHHAVPVRTSGSSSSTWSMTEKRGTEELEYMYRFALARPVCMLCIFVKIFIMLFE